MGFDVAPVPLGDSSTVEVGSLRIAVWDDDGYFPACAAAKRAVHEAAEALERLGATVEWIKPAVKEHLPLFYSIMGSDGGDDARQLARGSNFDHRVARLLWMAGVSLPVRWSVVRGLRLTGQRWLAHAVSHGRRRSAHGFWNLCDELGRFMESFYDEFITRRGFDAFLTPPHALPLMKHGAGIDMLPAASYSFVWNMLGLPAGVVPWTTVRAEETVPRATARDIVERRGEEALMGAEGLPVGVQIAGRAWQEHVVLAVMRALEASRVRL